MTESRKRGVLAGALALCLVLALGGQAMSDALVSSASGAETNRAVGQAASAYLTGLRTFGAAVLWNRLDPVSHKYYEGVGLDSQLYILSTIAAVQALDPHAVQSYYIGSWVLVKNDGVDEALEMAERGFAENPDSGILAMNLSQFRMLYADDLSGAVEIAKQVIEREMIWADVIEQANALPVIAAIFEKAGRTDLVKIIEEKAALLDAELGDQTTTDVHDHDGDGESDH